MAGLRAQATWKATVNSSKAIYLDFGTIQVLISHAAIQGYTEGQIQLAVDGLVGDLLPEGKSVFVHLNDDGSVAIAVGATEPKVWPEDWVEP